jgi:uncharacterized ferredoxin-like protein
MGVNEARSAAVSNGMPTVETKLVEIQEGEVLAWRAEELVRAGYDGDNALMLALERAVDLHAAVDLLRRGCPPDLAVKILL